MPAVGAESSRRFAAASSRVGERTSARIGARPLARRFATRLQAVQDRQRERGRLAGAGLGAAEHVAAGEHCGIACA